VEVQFPKEYNQPVKYSSKGRYEAHFINVFARYSNKSGYFLLKIDPMADSVSAIGFVPRMKPNKLNKSQIQKSAALKPQTFVIIKPLFSLLYLIIYYYTTLSYFFFIVVFRHT